MTERPFEALGLSADADRAYPLLVAARGVTPAELARRMGVTADRARAACLELAARDLVRIGRGDRWYPVPPQSGLLPLVVRAEEQLRRSRELLDRLDQEYRRVHEGQRAEEAVRVIEGDSAIRSRIAEAHAGARKELMVFSRTVPGRPGHSDPLTGGPDTAHPTGRSRGPRRRVVVERAGLEAQGAAVPYTGPDQPPMSIRVTERLPARMVVADRNLALLPPAADARPPDPLLLVIRPSSLLEALITLFEAVWTAAVPLARPTAAQPHNALHLRILAMLVTGSTDVAMARALGVAVRTVQRHIASMQRDAGVDNRVQLVWHAARHGWLDDDPLATETPEPS
ncbi:helix-turn-helix transcriptional regulator [Actinacidiphila acididurans]|uniref:HTH luxR-type domain-containing protein n=1 Tax=Actinacidiphila acididurans TaxID=2784346 RepID=A0ABS2U196_9ACTN|nr:LuxR C-terminal-related transcriptional regulator [Actinacidiphila acididurans]MBM9509373.1 hypothetical protein [Actinacidiphila acididurans]